MNGKHLELGTDWTENQEWVKSLEKLTETAAELVSEQYAEKGNWFEAFSAVLFLAETKIFDPRFENALGRGQVKRIRDNVAVLRHEVDELMDRYRSLSVKDGKDVPEETRSELLVKIQKLL